jgi:hypothetical protein
MFKVGERVKLVGSVFWKGKYYTNKVGIVIKVNIDSSFQYDVHIDTVDIPVGEWEMEKVVTKGQQLLFEFMK